MSQSAKSNFIFPCNNKFTQFHVKKRSKRALSYRFCTDKRLFIAALLSLAIFMVDVTGPLAYQAWPLYLIPLFFAYQSAKRPYIFSVIVALLVIAPLYPLPADAMLLLPDKENIFPDIANRILPEFVNRIIPDIANRILLSLSGPLSPDLANRINGILVICGVSVLLTQFRHLNICLLQARNDLEMRVKDRTAELCRINLSLTRQIDERINAEEEIRRLNEELERRVKERTAELDAANKELEAFTYSVSHDLRAPLRHISAFTDLLRKNIAEHMNEKSQKYIDLISTASRQMDLLITDLLAFSHVGRAELRKRKINFNTLVTGVIHEIQHQLHGRNISWQIDELPEAPGDQSLLRLVLVNLLSNAVKFTSKSPQAEIKIRCEEEIDEFCFSVADNGAGFDMRHVDKLFGVFQRLHSQDEFEGTGIGLANVQRIISRHGGKVWAESVLGKGATFHFTLPKRSIGAPGIAPN
jgi:signal transduction histidine kinase